MGLLDSITGQVFGSLGGSGAAGQPEGLASIIGGLLNNPQTGGLGGLITAFEQKGLGDLIGSWVSTGQNLSISAEQLQMVLGNDQVQALAQKLGLSTQDVSAQLAEHLPNLVDQLTPDGTVPEAGSLGGLLGMIKGAAS